MALPVPFDPQGFPIVNAITWDGGAVGPGVPIELPPEDITQVTTDAGTFRGNFPGASLYRAINGGLTLTTGSTDWARANTVTALRVGDYVEIIADHSDAVPVMAQIATIANDGLSGTLRTAYAGAGGALAAAQVSDWWVYFAGAGAAIAVGAGVCTLTPGAAAASRCTLARRLGPGGRKGCAPIWTRFMASQNANLPFQATLLGLTSALGSVVAMTQLAFHSFGGGNDTQVQEINAVDFAAGMFSNVVVDLPNGGRTTQTHLYEVEELEDQVNFYVDGQRTTFYPNNLHHQGLIPDPYQELYLIAQIENTGAAGGATVLTLLDAHAKSLDVVDVRSIQPDAEKLQVTAKLGLQPAQALPYPNPASYPATTPRRIVVDPAGNLAVRGPVLTDEDSFAGSFPGANLFRALTGTSAFTNGSNRVYGQGTLYTQEVRVGDYVERTAGHSDTAAVWAQVQSVDSDLELTLRTAYVDAGAGGAFAAARVCDWTYERTELGGEAIGVAALALTLTITGVAGERVYVARRLGAGGRKGSAPFYARIYGAPSVRRANQASFIGLLSSPVAGPAVLQMAGFNLAGVTTTQADCLAMRDYIAGVGSATTVTLPYAGDTVAAPHLYEVFVYEQQVFFFIDGLWVHTAQGGLEDPYAEMYLVIMIQNTAGAAGGAVLSITDAHEKSLDVLDTRPTQPDAEKLRVTPVVPSAPAMSVSVTVDSDLEHIIAATTQIGHRYRVSVVGGEGMCIRCDGVAPVVTNEPWWDGQKYEFISRVGANTVRAIKRTAGTQNGDVIVTSLDGGYLT